MIWIWMIVLTLLGSATIAFFPRPKRKSNVLCSAWWACPNRAVLIVHYRRHQAKHDQVIYCCRQCLATVIDCRRYSGTIITEDLI